MKIYLADGDYADGLSKFSLINENAEDALKKYSGTHSILFMWEDGDGLLYSTTLKSHKVQQHDLQELSQLVSQVLKDKIRL